MKEQDGGAAFPQIEHSEFVRDGQYVEKWWPSGGMSLRDYFAGQALQTVAAGVLACVVNGQPVPPSGFAELAAAAYRYADAMLEARK